MNRDRQIYLFAFFLIAASVSFALDPYASSLAAAVRNPFLDNIMEWFSHEISVFFILVVISAMFMYEERKSKFIIPLLISFFVGLIVSYAFKFLIMRVRPEGIVYVTISIFDMMIKFPDYSFPSSHAALAFSVLPVLDREFRKVKYFWIFFSVIVAVSRVYLNYHYLSDVVAGCIIGYLAGYLVLKAGVIDGISKKFFHDI